MSNVQNLRQAVKRLGSLQMDHPGSSELTRFRDIIIPDLEGRLTDAEKIEYTNLVSGKTVDQLRKEAALELQQMNANRDKPSI
jgi:hypothetical protein